MSYITLNYTTLKCFFLFFVFFAKSQVHTHFQFSTVMVTYSIQKHYTNHLDFGLLRSYNIADGGKGIMVLLYYASKMAPPLCELIKCSPQIRLNVSSYLEAIKV